jgi:hypothetical protein
MPASSSTRIHETDFCAEIATFSTGIFGAHPEYPFRSARVEGFGKGAAKLKRKDLRFYDETGRVLLCGEVKFPGTPEGMSPYSEELVRDAHEKADDAGVQYFFTWNVNLFVLWDRKNGMSRCWTAASASGNLAFRSVRQKRLVVPRPSHS